MEQQWNTPVFFYLGSSSAETPVSASISSSSSSRQLASMYSVTEGKEMEWNRGWGGVYKNSIKVAVHQTSLANHSDFTCCFPLLLERHRLGLRLPLHLLAQNECVYTCVCMKECLCIGTMFCNTHAEGQQGINGANLGSLERGLYSEQHSTHSTENHSCNVTCVIYCLSFS